MALAETTLSTAAAAADTKIVVASATSIVAGRLLQIDGEMMQVAQSYTLASTTVPVLRGRSGTAVVAHAASARVVHGDAADWGTPGAGALAQFAPGGRIRRVVSYSASGAIALPQPGEDLLVILNGTGALAMTLAVPTKDLDGCKLEIAGNGAAAHTVTFSGGLSGAGASYDVVTVNAAAPVLIEVTAVNEVWISKVAVPMSGTVTNITAGVA